MNYNGTLLSIDSEEEQGFVSRVLSQEPFDIFINAQFVWTGLFQLNGQWRQPECKVSNVLKDTHLNSFKNLISKRYTRFVTDWQRIFEISQIKISHICSKHGTWLPDINYVRLAGFTFGIWPTLHPTISTFHVIYNTVLSIRYFYLE